MTAGWPERAEAALARAGRKRGGARRAVLELLDRQSCALSVQEIERALHEQPRSASRASVYRVLEELTQAGLVQRVRVVDAAGDRFERTREESEHHHHLVCERCGRVAPFRDRGLERAIARVSATVALSVSAHEVLLRGRCESCAAARQPVRPTGS